MKILERYLATSIVSMTLLVLLMLVGLTIFINLIKELSEIGTGTYGLFNAAVYVLLDLPRTLYAFFPMAALIGVMLSLSLLAHHSELIIFRISGISSARINFTVIKVTCLLLLGATLIGECLAPLAEHSAENRKALSTSHGQALVTGRGVWVRDGTNILNIRTVIGTNRIQGVNRYVFDNDGNLVRASHADAGLYHRGTWIMQGVATSFITPSHVTAHYLPTEAWTLALAPKLLKISVTDPDAMSLLQLNDYMRYLKSNNLNSAVYALAFWQRLLQPLATLVMVWLAVPFVFGSLRSMTVGLRVVSGIMTGFGFFILNKFFGPFSIVYQWPPFLAAAIPIALFALAALLLQRRVH